MDCKNIHTYIFRYCWYGAKMCLGCSDKVNHIWYDNNDHIIWYTVVNSFWMIMWYDKQWSYMWHTIAKLILDDHVIVFGPRWVIPHQVWVWSQHCMGIHLPQCCTSGKRNISLCHISTKVSYVIQDKIIIPIIYKQFCCKIHIMCRIKWLISSTHTHARIHTHAHMHTQQSIITSNILLICWSSHRLQWLLYSIYTPICSVK